MAHKFGDVAPTFEAGVRVGWVEVEAADRVDEGEVAVVLNRLAQLDGVAVGGISTEVEVILHVFAHQGVYGDLSWVLDESHGDQ
jgi:hypothetical protein